jgi:hypothetical protein
MPQDIIAKLMTMQIAQMQYDEHYAQAVTNLPIQQRLNHMVLHYSKYGSTICNYVLNSIGDSAAYKRVLIDAFIITLCCANILNVKLSENAWYDIGAEGQPLLFMKDYLCLVGTMAKACEAIDHFEAYNYRKTLEVNVIEMCNLLLAEFDRLNLNVELLVNERRSKVQSASIFYKEAA